MILDLAKPTPQKKHISGQGESSTPDHGSANATDLSYRNRAWCGALFDKEHPPVWDEKQMEYLCYSPEICPETKNFHYQWYVYFKNPKMLKAAVKYMQKHWSPKATIGSRGKGGYKVRGTPEQNRTYCGADDYLCEKTQKSKKANPDFKEFGKLPKQGERKDLKEITDSILEGTETVDSILVDDPMKYHQYGRTLEKVQTLALRKKHRSWMTQGYWYHGGTGVGKSHTAFNEFGEYSNTTHYVGNLRQIRRGFWTGYTGQETVIINEFRGQIPFGELMDLVDKWPMTVDVKCGEPVPFLAKRLIITGPKSPQDTYKGMTDTKDSMAQLMRRFEIKKLASGRRAEKGGEGRTA